jgi:hypothetical protein
MARDEAHRIVARCKLILRYIVGFTATAERVLRASGLLPIRESRHAAA